MVSSPEPQKAKQWDCNYIRPLLCFLCACFCPVSQKQDPGLWYGNLYSCNLLEVLKVSWSLVRLGRPQGTQLPVRKILVPQLRSAGMLCHSSGDRGAFIGSVYFRNVQVQWGTRASVIIVCVVTTRGPWQLRSGWAWSYTLWYKGRADCLVPQWLHAFLLSTSELPYLFYIYTHIFNYRVLLCNFEECVSLQKLYSALINSTGYLISSVAEDR